MEVVGVKVWGGGVRYRCGDGTCMCGGSGYRCDPMGGGRCASCMLLLGEKAGLSAM